MPPFKRPSVRVIEAPALLCRYFNQPPEVKAKYPSVDWGAVKLLGYEVNKMHEGGMAPDLPRCLPLIWCNAYLLQHQSNLLAVPTTMPRW